MLMLRLQIVSHPDDSQSQMPILHSTALATAVNRFSSLQLTAAHVCSDSGRNSVMASSYDKKTKNFTCVEFTSISFQIPEASSFLKNMIFLPRLVRNASSDSSRACCCSVEFCFLIQTL
eukprot:gnl/TRDRNA2_/TRDRNA2_177709_c16_seq4.p1 gnl/TRDRNA2_/TRDRNA2_177709_c16~~gnl/TRDRNA2_/TRDRNA2_177709_c16_seq4.p1  ORF type:complete len:119 (-),score=3.72 gnl/TRDRNA2_/TRDRNA2_177709_c16_seq4:28-384(-)